jgi:hypothetical protein
MCKFFCTWENGFICDVFGLCKSIKKRCSGQIFIHIVFGAIQSVFGALLVWLPMHITKNNWSVPILVREAAGGLK